MSAFIAPRGMSTKQEAHLRSKTDKVLQEGSNWDGYIHYHLHPVHDALGVVARDFDVSDGDGKTEQDGHDD